MNSGHYKLDPSPARKLTEQVMQVIRRDVGTTIIHPDTEEKVYTCIDQYLNRPVWSKKTK